MKLNLAPSGLEKPILINKLQALLVPLALYILVAGASWWLGSGFHGLIQPDTDLQRAVTQRAQFLARHSQEPALVLNFLANLRRLGRDESQAFQAAGLTHLLAISGAQLSLMASLGTRALGFALGMTLGRALPPSRLIPFIAWNRALSRIIISLGLAGLFGQTGALLRASVLASIIHTHSFSRLAQRVVRRCLSPLKVPSLTLTRLLGIAALLPFLPSPFLSLSFLLSAMGASVAEEASRLATHISQRTHTKLAWILSTLLTCTLIHCILAPLTGAQLTPSVIANTLAIPLVSLIITPISLFVLLSPSTTVALTLLPVLDVTLGFFSDIATFCGGNSTHLPPDNQWIFSWESRAYLTLITGVLWSVQDARREESTKRLIPS